MPEAFLLLAVGAMVFDGLLLLRAGAGSRPGGRGTFLCFAKETYPKERRPCCLRPSASLRATWGARARGAPWNSLRACGAPFRQPRRVRSRSGCVLRHTRHPAPCAPQAHPEGVGSQHPLGPLLRSAAVSRAQAPRAAQPGPSAAMARVVVGLFRLFTPIWLRLRRCACGVSVCRRTHASLSSSPWLFERRAQRKASSTAHPASPPTQVAPAPCAGVADSGVAFSLVTFFWRSKRKLLRRRAHTPAPALCRGQLQTIKTIATTAFRISASSQKPQRQTP